MPGHGVAMDSWHPLLQQGLLDRSRWHTRD